ncbi:MAG: methionine adenosyltransferase [Patescibacteria group bacterium]
MRINFNFYSQNNQQTSDIVERKGIGHPDTLADLIAEDFSNTYSKYCLKKFGGILNHWVDKIVLSGGVSELEYGSKKIIKPITAYLFGKAVDTVGDSTIPIEDMFIDSCKKVFRGVFRDKKILDAITYKIDINNGIGKEHAKQFYAPSTKKDILTAESFKSNDTIICSGYAPYSITERLAIDIENYINSNKFKNKFAYTGYDVKVMIARTDNFFDITVCIPFIADRTPSFDFYRIGKDIILKELKKFISGIRYFDGNFDFSININTKDFGEHAYLVAFGSALDKGDFGAVGRGNKYSGVISLNRKTNIEAVAGKNPQNHSGKLFTIFAHHLAWKLYKIFHRNISIDISAKNGEDIDKPSYVIINVENGPVLSARDKNSIEDIVIKDIRKIKKYADLIINKNIIKEHIKKTFIYD